MATEFFLGQVTQVFLKSDDGNVTKAVSSQQIDIQSLDSILPTTGKPLSASPLIRGISDSITKGDLVLFTILTDGQVYYIGPINSFNNPNNSSNPVFTSNRTNRGFSDLEILSSNGYGAGYPYVNQPKLIKQRSVDLDNLKTEDVYNTAKFTDMLFEGRHGNSIRIGSRSTNPSLIISNGNTLPIETPMEGSVIGMLSNGSIEQNFFSDKIGREKDIQFFRVSTDSIFENISPRYQIGIGNNVLGSDNTDIESLDTIYKFSEDTDDVEILFDQILITSDRLIFNSRSNVGDISISSGRNINLGAAVNFTLNNQGQSVINSGNIYLGEKARDKKEPMVLGDELRALLLKFAEILQDSRALVQGVPIPLYDRETGSPMFNRIQALIDELKERTPDDNGVYDDGPTKFLSKKHFIETNTDRSNNNEG